VKELNVLAMGNDRTGVFSLLGSKEGLREMENQSPTLENDFFECGSKEETLPMNAGVEVNERVLSHPVDESGEIHLLCDINRKCFCVEIKFCKPRMAHHTLVFKPQSNGCSELAGIPEELQTILKIIDRNESAVVRQS
jgi:hypothetical protein